MAPGRELCGADADTIATTQAFLRECLDVAATVGAGAIAGPIYTSTGRTWRISPDERASLYAELRGSILEGRLRPGTRLPASRDFARQHSLSRGTVVVVFERQPSRPQTSPITAISSAIIRRSGGWIRMAPEGGSGVEAVQSRRACGTRQIVTAGHVHEPADKKTDDFH